MGNPGVLYRASDTPQFSVSLPGLRKSRTRTRKRSLTLCVLCVLIVFVIFLFQSLVFAQQGQFQSLVSGMEHYRDGNYEKALEEFQKSLTIFPDDPDIPFYIGLTYLRLNQPEKAIEYFQKTVSMDPSYTDAHFQLGVALIQQKAYQEAITHLEEVYEREPEREDLGYFLGFASYQIGQYRKALDYLEAGRTKDKTISGLTLYYMALAKQQLGLTKEAADVYRQVITLDPTSPLAAPSQRLIETIELKEQLKKRLNVEVTAKLQYDDNVVLIPTTNVFRLREKDRKSWANLFFLRGEYFFLRHPNVDLSASYGLFQTLYYNVKDSNVQDHIFSGDFLARGTLGVPFNFRLNYSYDYLLLDSHYFLQRHTLRPNLILQWSPRHLSVVQYTFQIKDFRETPVSPENDRDAQNHEAGIVHFLRFAEGKHYLKAGYFYEREVAKGSNWEYQADRFLAGFQFTFPKDIRLNGDYQYAPVRYKNPNIFFTEEGERRDIDRMFMVTLSKDVIKNLTIYLEYLYRRNSSNIALFDYEKNLYSVGVSWRY